MRTLKEVIWKEDFQEGGYKLIVNPGADILSIGIDGEANDFTVKIFGIIGSLTDEEIQQGTFDNGVASPLAFFNLQTYKLVDDGSGITEDGLYETAIEGIDAVVVEIRSNPNNSINRIIIRFADSTVA